MAEISHKCINCAIYRSNNKTCPIFNRDTSLDRGCPMYTNIIDPCDICGGHILRGSKTVYVDGDSQHQVCDRCATAISQNSCQVCKKGQYCAFQQDTSCTLPPIITVQQRQGNAVVQMQQKNPARIEQTCMKCECFINDMCMREIGKCDKSEINWENI